MRLATFALLALAGASTAAAQTNQQPTILLTIFAGAGTGHGLWVVEPDRLTELIRWVHDLGWSIDTHTCGDEAQDVVVRAYVAAQTSNPKPWLRHRVHHAYFPTPETRALPCV